MGLDVTPNRVINIQEAIYPAGFTKKKHFIFINILCYSKTDKVSVDNDEVQSYVWVKPKDALKLKLSKYTKRTIKDIIKRTAGGFYLES